MLYFTGQVAHFPTMYLLFNAYFEPEPVRCMPNTDLATQINTHVVHVRTAYYDNKVQ